MESVLAQSYPAAEVVVCIDHNPELLGVVRGHWDTGHPPVHVTSNRYPGRLGSARNSALERVYSDVVAFLDDDALAPVDWLHRLATAYAAHPGVQAIGGAPQPEYESPRPDWFPHEFDWVFGCAYRGLPETRASIGRLIGANMSVRRSAVLSVGGFHSDDHDDMDLSHRIIATFGAEAVLYAPDITVSHFVTSQRLRWSYFWRRCFFVNRGKVLAHHEMGNAGNSGADLDFARRALLEATPRYLRQGRSGLRRAAATLAGLGLAGMGNAVGQLSLRAGRTAPSLTRGLDRGAVARGVSEITPDVRATRVTDR